MAGILYNKIVKCIINAVCDGPVHIGSASGEREDVLVHPVEGCPFIQASSLAGVFRDYYAKSHTQAETDDLFGATGVAENSNSYDYRSRIKFSDGLFNVNTVKMELRPHVRIDRESGSVSSSNGSGQKFEMEYIGKGAEFTTTIYLYTDSDKCDKDVQDLKEMLAQLKAGNLNVGGKKSSGAGNVVAKSVYVKVFDMTRASDRKQWSNEETLGIDSYKNVIGELPKPELTSIAYKITVTGATEGALLVKGIATSKFGEGAADCENIKNAKGEYIVPGSSLRGTVRSQMEKISEYIGKASIIEQAYGTVGSGADTGCAGNLIFKDTVVQSTKKNDDMLRHRIHIDKFTGGVFNGGLFAESNITGNVEMNISILNKNNADATLGLLIMSLRDLAAKTMSIGGGYATGKGFVNVDTIKIEAAGEVATLSFHGESAINDPSGIIEKAINALKEVA